MFYKPLAIMTFASFTMFGCASSDSTTDTTAMDSSMSESATMAGSVEERDVDAVIVEEKVVVPVATLSVTALSMENTIEVDDMFEDIGDTEQYDVMSLARTSPNLSTFVKLVEQAGLEAGLQNLEKLTLFAPTNEAFAKMPKDKLESLLMPENKAMLSRMLQAHFLSSEVTALRLRDNDRIQITEDSYIAIETPSVGNVVVGGARLINSDIEASNGRIHVVDAVILPSEDVRKE